MKYTVGTDIDKPRDEVVALFMDPENRPKWQRGLVSVEVLDGEAGQAGARSKLVFQMGKRKMEMLENLTVAEPPDVVEHTYDAKGVHNIVRTRFVEVAPDKTRVESDNEFQFQGFMKVVSFLMKGAFPKQSMKIMNDFKALAEQGQDVRGADA